MDTAELMTLAWFAILAFGVFMYVFLDGFVLGIGILSAFAGSDAARDTMMNSVAPVWDGNETWLVLGGGGLLAAFPLAYAIILPALYAPLIAMLLGLVLRGVAFEFRFKARDKRGWNMAFAGGSVIATFCQGVTLGAIVQGVAARGGQYVGGAFDWLSGFSLLTGCALVAGYALLGASWMIVKTGGTLQDRAFAWTQRLLWTVLAFMVGVSLWVPTLDAAYAERWFGWPGMLWLAPLPLAAAVIGYGLRRSVIARRETAPFVWTLALFASGFAGLAASFWPQLIPPHITIWNAAAPPASQSFLMAGMVFLLPFILGYTAWSYWIFRGKVTRDMGYH